MKALLLIDPQIDFISGSLPVPGSQEIMDDLARYIEKYGNQYGQIIISTDQHPITHCSFIENGGQWPTHCVARSEGAAIYDPIMQAIIKVVRENKDSRIETAIIEKGCNPNTEEYSLVDNELNRKLIREIIESKNIDQIDISGIAGDICVCNSVRGLLDMKLNATLNVMEEFCPSLDDGSTLHKLLVDNHLI